MPRIDPTFAGRIIPAMAVFALMCSFLLSMPTSLIAARESGLLWEVFPDSPSLFC